MLEMRQPAADARERLIVVSNRGPVEYGVSPDGAICARVGEGGVATALRRAARLEPFVWLSSPLSDADRIMAATPGWLPGWSARTLHRFVLADLDAYELFYSCFSNQVLWFLQHSLPWPEDLDAAKREAAWQRGYLPINQAFADATVEEMDAKGIKAVMFHDYHFYAAPFFVRAARPRSYLQHFIHIPWPGPDAWRRLDPTLVASICAGLLSNDSVVFQAAESAANFQLTCARFLPGVSADVDAGTVQSDQSTTRVWANPISADPQELVAATRSVGFRRALCLRSNQSDEQVIVRVDRLDPSKNVLAGFEAFRLLLESHPELVGRVRFLAFLIPTRSSIRAYREYQRDVFALVEEINQSFGSSCWSPVTVTFANNRPGALAAMSLADVLLVNSLADGMNLVAKEGPLVSKRDAVLVLSSQVGAYQELASGAIAIDPHDVRATAEALYRALTLPGEERRQLALHLRKTLLAHDLESWFSRLIADIDEHAFQERSRYAGIDLRARRPGAPAPANGARSLVGPAGRD